MARKYSRGAAKKVKRAMHKKKRGTLKSGRSGKKVTSRKQAIAIGLSEARREGKKVPRKEEKEEELMAKAKKKAAAPRSGAKPRTRHAPAKSGKPNRKPQQNKRGGNHGIVRDERGQDQPRDRGAT